MSDKIKLSKLNCSWYYNWSTEAFNTTLDEGVQQDVYKRQILNNDMSVRHITELMNQREPRYNSVADIQVNVDKGDRVETCYYILKELEKTGHFSVE